MNQDGVEWEDLEASLSKIYSTRFGGEQSPEVERMDAGSNSSLCS
jgi:hypothetical protein